LVSRTGEALGRIVTQVVEINAVIGDIAASAQEQSTGLGQVNTAVNEMDQVTQKNAAMVEEMTAAAHRLAGESEELGQLVARYQIRGAATKEDPLRAELKKAAPHAFRASPKTAAPAAPEQSAPQARAHPPTRGQGGRQWSGRAQHCKPRRERRLAGILSLAQFHPSQRPAALS
jgi:methyl-accepting chemotaxis protein